jgi:hypothetical protein
MTVSELIEELKNYPSNMRVVIPGYEGGEEDIINLEVVKLKLDVHKEWYYGSHEVVCDSFSKDENWDEEALRIS